MFERFFFVLGVERERAVEGRFGRGAGFSSFGSVVFFFFRSIYNGVIVVF